MAENGNEPRRSLRLALGEVSLNESTPERPNKSTSPDELVIIQRGPRRKPITWSPVEADALMSQPKDQTPEEKPPRRSELNPRIRKRLIMSPTKNSSTLGHIIAKKLRSLPRFDSTITDK